jgi:hypothetical protein
MFTDISEERTAAAILFSLKMEAGSSSEKLVKDYHITRRHMPEDSTPA